MKTNLEKQNLHGDNIGVFFGTFAPLHIGHQAELYKAVGLNDGVVLVTSGYKGDRGDQIGLPINKRFRYLREAFNDEPNIKVAKLIEDDIPKMPDGWDVWLDKLVEIVMANVDNQNAHITFYTGEENYKLEIEKRLTNREQFEVSLMDRTILNISATEIRRSPIENWDYINRVFRRHFTRKVTILGAEKSGKSTLVRRIARTSSSPFSEQFMQRYQEQSNVNDEELDVQDFVRLIQGQFDNNSNEIRAASNNGLTIFDGSVIDVKTRANLLLNEQQNKQLKSLFDSTIQKELNDLILVIPPKNSEDNYFQELMKTLEEYRLLDKTVVLNKIDNNQTQGYYQRYIQAIEAIQEYTKFNIKHVVEKEE